MGNAPYDLHNISGYYIARPGKRQEKIAQNGNSDKYDAFDYKGKGVGRLGYHLTAYMDENNKKLFIDFINNCKGNKK